MNTGKIKLLSLIEMLLLHLSGLKETVCRKEGATGWRDLKVTKPVACQSSPALSSPPEAVLNRLPLAAWCHIILKSLQFHWPFPRARGTTVTSASLVEKLLSAVKYAEWATWLTALPCRSLKTDSLFSRCCREGATNLRGVEDVGEDSENQGFWTSLPESEFRPTRAQECAFQCIHRVIGFRSAWLYMEKAVFSGSSKFGNCEISPVPVYHAWPWQPIYKTRKTQFLPW